MRVSNRIIVSSSPCRTGFLCPSSPLCAVPAPNSAIQYSTIQYNTIQSNSMLGSTILYYAILYHIILYYTILYYYTLPLSHRQHPFQGERDGRARGRTPRLFLFFFHSVYFVVPFLSAKREDAEAACPDPAAPKSPFSFSNSFCFFFMFFLFPLFLNILFCILFFLFFFSYFFSFSSFFLKNLFCFFCFPPRSSTAGLRGGRCKCAKVHQLRPISLLTLWISEGLTRAQ